MRLVALLIGVLSVVVLVPEAGRTPTTSPLESTTGEPDIPGLAAPVVSNTGVGLLEFKLPCESGCVPK